MNLRKVKPTGPQPCPYLLIGERPGRVENSRGYCFCGPSGEELDRYLRVNSGLDRANVRVCNLVPYYAEEPPTPEEVQRHLPELWAEIEQTQPEFVGLVGLHSERAVLGSDIEMEVFHGLGFPCSRCSRCGRIYRESVSSNRETSLGLLAVEKHMQRSPKVRSKSTEQAASDTLDSDAVHTGAQISLPMLQRANPRQQGTPSRMREQSVRESVAHRALDSNGARSQALEKSVCEWASESRECVSGREGSEVSVQSMCSCEYAKVQSIGLMPLFHPAAGLHRSDVAAKIQWDFTQFGRMIRGEKLPTGHLADAVPEPFYAERHAVPPALLAVTGVDTEGSVDKPWGWSASVRCGEGCVIRGEGSVDGLAVLHNALADLPVLEALGVKIGRWTDNMLKAALLGTEPLGLKPLARRHCGMLMQDYADVVREARQEKALEYLSRVVDWSANGTH